MVPLDIKIEKLYYDRQFEKRTSSCCNNRVYCGNKQDLFLVIFLWAIYFILSLYFLVVISPYFWVEYSPAITIIGIVISIPGIYNAIKCFFTDPGILKKNTYIKQEQKDIEANIKENVEQMNPAEIQDKQQGQEEKAIAVQKAEIIDKNQHLEKEEINIDQYNLIESTNKVKIISPLNSFEIKQKEEKEQMDDWIIRMQKGLSQINNGLQNVDNNLQQIQNGLKNFEDQEFVVEEIQPNQMQSGIQNSNPAQPLPNSKKKYQGGNLFEERYCETCKIIRPPLASHCTDCNHCVKNYDHHCNYISYKQNSFYMGNCVGERNHKNFYLFLQCSYIWMFYCLVFSIISFADNVGQNGFVFVQFYEEVYIFYIFIAFTSLLLLTIVCKINERITKIVAVPAGIVIIISYFWIATYSGMEYYSNPVLPLLGILVYASSIIALTNFYQTNCYLVCVGSTLKQQTFKSRNQIKNEKFTYKQGCINLVKFLTFKPSKSQILNDL